MINNIINRLKVPKVILRYIMMNFLDISSINNLLLTVKEMNILDNYSKDLIVKAIKGFNWNCKSGHLTVAQWLYVLGNVDIYATNKDAFRLACQNGHLTVAQWLYSLDNVTIHEDNEYTFKWSCINGHLTVAQWLYSLCNVNIYSAHQDTFKWSCASGHLAVAQWLYSLGNFNCDGAFAWACIHGHLTVAQWLYSIGVSSNVYKDAFTCGKKNILDWLQVNSDVIN